MSIAIRVLRLLVKFFAFLIVFHFLSGIAFSVYVVFDLSKVGKLSALQFHALVLVVSIPLALLYLNKAEVNRPGKSTQL
ncbi:MAG: hypothetical protein JNK75_10285 [Betaproteobacteria bacterium]|nr:hypothetical protein [Betaproteobacteria bacterium]